MIRNFSNQKSKLVISKKMKKIHIIKRNLLYLSNIPKDLPLDLLITDEFLGHYGKIQKSCIKSSTIEHSQTESLAVLITYEREIDACLAILALNNFQINNQILKASFGITRYCSSFLQNKKCKSKKCYFLHVEAEERDIIKIKDNNLKDCFMEEEDQMMVFILSSNLRSNVFEILKNEKKLKSQEFSLFFPNKVTSVSKIKKYIRHHPEILNLDIKKKVTSPPEKDFYDKNHQKIFSQNESASGTNHVHLLKNTKVINEKKKFKEDAKFNPFNIHSFKSNSKNNNRLNYNYFKRNEIVSPNNKPILDDPFFEKITYQNNSIHNHSENKISLEKNSKNGKSTSFFNSKNILSHEVYGVETNKKSSLTTSTTDNFKTYDSEESTIYNSNQNFTFSEALFYKYVQKNIVFKNSKSRYPFVVLTKNVHCSKKNFWKNIQEFFDSEMSWFYEKILINKTL